MNLPVNAEMVTIFQISRSRWQTSRWLCVPVGPRVSWPQPGSGSHRVRNASSRRPRWSWCFEWDQKSYHRDSYGIILSELCGYHLKEEKMKRAYRERKPPPRQEDRGKGYIIMKIWLRFYLYVIVEFEILPTESPVWTDWTFYQVLHGRTYLFGVLRRF